LKIEHYYVPTLNFDISLHYCGYEDVAADFRVGPHTRDCYLIHYVLKGEGFFEANKKVFPVNAGDIFVIFPNEIISYYTDSKNPWSFYWFAFNGKRSMEILSSAGISRNLPVKTLIAHNFVVLHMENLIAAMNREFKMNSSYILSCLYLLLSDLEAARSADTKIKTKNDKKNEYVQQAIYYIECNYFKDITVQIIADFVCLERTYFSKIFHKVTGKTPQRYILQYRLERATVLMSTTLLNLSQICKCVGIEEESYFSRAYKNMYAVTPKKQMELERKVHTGFPFV